MAQCFKKQNKNVINSLIILFFVCSVILSCVSIPPSAALSMTREILVPELDGVVYISAISHLGKSVSLTRDNNIKVRDDTKRIAILSFQIQNVKRKKVYQFSPIFLLDGDVRILPDAVKYFRGNSVIGVDWGVGTRNILNNSLTMSRKRNGKYTVNLIYVIDENKIITRAEFFGQIIEFNPELVNLSVDLFNNHLNQSVIINNPAN
jgi:hypothetical protein